MTYIQTCGMGSLLGQSRVIYQWLRIEQLDQWWHWLTLALVCLLVSIYVIGWYRRDSVEHQRPVRWALTLLRLSAFVGLLLYFMQLDKRTEQRVVRDSRVAVIVDTSMSMSLPGTPSYAGVANPLTRADEATQLIGASPFLQQLSSQHQVTVYRFDQLARPTALAALNKVGREANVEGNEPLQLLDGLRAGRQLAWMALLLGGLGVAMLVLALGAQIVGVKEWLIGSRLLLLGAVLSLAGLAVMAFAILPNTNYPLAALLGANLPPLSADTTATDSESEDLLQATLPTDWKDSLAPRGSETRLGDAIKSVLDRESGSPLAGIVVLSDGRSNAGLVPKEVLAAAQNARVPLYAIGLGSDRSPSNLAVVEVDAPRRLYPGDRFSLTTLIGSSGFPAESVTVQVLAGKVGASVEQMSIEAEQLVQISDDGSLTSAVFELTPKTVGDWQYAAQVLPLTGDADTRDNLLATEVEVIERKNRVLVLAGGPTREYQFVRNLLFRDRDVESHVLLQTGTESTSQEAQELLTEFPADRAALSQYDAILAFDADWTLIPDRSVEALEQWVAEQAGGFLLVAGSVEMPQWLARSSSGVRSQYLRSLSPVVLEQRGSALLAAGRVESEVVWPLTLTVDGQQSDFLWLSDDPKTSQELWAEFEGVHTFYSAFELKPGAKALLYFSDPSSAVDGQLPIYMASQFYGAGRSVFLAGGELWRLRKLGDQYFDRLYTKLVRWISQGRLLLDSDRGVLLVDREQALLGDQIVLRAVLKNERYEPLLQSEVVVRLIDPQQRNLPIVLRPLADGSQPGVYTGQFPILYPGDYSVQLQLGSLGSNEVLTASVKAKVPAVEMQRAERNDGLLRQLTVDSGGKYWIGIERAVAPVEGGVADIIQSITPQDQVAYLPGTPDRVFQIRWLGWLMTWIAGCLSLEWLTRRLHRLA